MPSSYRRFEGTGETVGTYRLNSIEIAHSTYSRAEMLAILRGLDATLDRPIQGLDIQRQYEAGKGPSLKMFLKTFGTLSKARRAARTQTAYRKAQERTTFWQKYTKEELVTQLKALGRKHHDHVVDEHLRFRCASLLGVLGK